LSSCLDVSQQFTLKERDTETGLDYFGIRYYSSFQGRFTASDLAGPDLMNPQTLNRYQYCLNNPMRYIDRQGLYEEDVHRDLTFALALAAGFNTHSAHAIASANQYVDDNPATTPMGMTPWGDNMKKRELYHFTTENRRNELWSSFEASGSLQDLGSFFHAQQDSFSHAGFGARWGHASAGHAPDKTYNDPGKADNMAYDTFSRMTTAVTLLVKNGKESISYAALDYKSISPMVQAFNRANTAEEKKKIINQIVTEVQRQHYEQDRAKEEQRKKKEESRQRKRQD
jgi:RHS repeat-associated protein